MSKCGVRIESEIRNSRIPNGARHDRLELSGFEFDCRICKSGCNRVIISHREKVALVTGSGKRRVGNAIAAALAARGYSIALHYNRSADEAQDVAGRPARPRACAPRPSGRRGR